MVTGKAFRNTTTTRHNGMAAFRGFRGRYRLSWKDADGEPVSKTVDVFYTSNLQQKAEMQRE